MTELQLTLVGLVWLLCGLAGWLFDRLWNKSWERVDWFDLPPCLVLGPAILFAFIWIACKRRVRGGSDG